jgi:hypothetical protein
MRFQLFDFKLLFFQNFVKFHSYNTKLTYNHSMKMGIFTRCYNWEFPPTMRPAIAPILFIPLNKLFFRCFYRLLENTFLILFENGLAEWISIWSLQLEINIINTASFGSRERILMCSRRRWSLCYFTNHRLFITFFGGSLILYEGSNILFS